MASALLRAISNSLKTLATVLPNNSNNQKYLKENGRKIGGKGEEKDAQHSMNESLPRDLKIRALLSLGKLNNMRISVE